MGFMISIEETRRIHRAIFENGTRMAYGRSGG
jgi:hypothetical protein